MQPRSTMRDHVLLVPALAAVVLGLLYLTGAVLKAGELRGADLKVRDTLPLFGIEQLLTRGISAGVAALVLSLLLVPMTFGTGYLLESRVRPLSSTPEPLRRKARWRRRVSLLVTLCVGIVLFPPIFVLGLFLCGAIGVAARRRGLPFLPLGVVMAVGVLGVLSLISSYFEPQRLPKVVIRTEGGTIVRGRLITEDGSSLYVTNRTGEYAIVPRDEVIWVQVRPEKDRRWKYTRSYIADGVEAIWP